MGGMVDGERASCIAVEDLSQHLDALVNYQDLPGFLENALRKIDRMIYQECGEGSGTTIVTAVILGNHLYWAAAGDSRIYILRNQQITQVTRDHNYSLLLEKDVEAGKITQEEALIHPQREALISYLGSGDVPLIDTNRTPIALEHGDMVLLCSDGLYKSLSDEEIRAIVWHFYGDIKEGAKRLPLIAFETGSGAKDNTSVVLMQYFV
jgi:protein phosphatase